MDSIAPACDDRDATSLALEAALNTDSQRDLHPSQRASSPPPYSNAPRYSTISASTAYLIADPTRDAIFPPDPVDNDIFRCSRTLYMYMGRRHPKSCVPVISPEEVAAARSTAFKMMRATRLVYNSGSTPERVEASGFDITAEDVRFARAERDAWYRAHPEKQRISDGEY